MRHLVLALALMSLLAGCASPADVPVEDVQLEVHVEAEGLRPVVYELVQRRFQPEVALDQQSGEVLWRAEGEVASGSFAVEQHLIAAEEDSWIEIHLAQGPSPVPAFSGVLEFHLDPAACHENVQMLLAKGTSDATSFHSKTTGNGCVDIS